MVDEDWAGREGAQSNSVVAGCRLPFQDFPIDNNIMLELLDGVALRVNSNLIKTFATFHDVQW